MRCLWATTVLLILIPAAVAAAPGSPPASGNVYRALRDSVQTGRFKAVELHARVIAVLSQGRYALDLTAADFARSGVPDDYPVALVAGRAHTTARFLSAQQASLRDRDAREHGPDVPLTTEVRLVVDNASSNPSASAVVLDAWSGELLFPIDLRPGDAVTITSSMPSPKGP